MPSKRPRDFDIADIIEAEDAAQSDYDDSAPSRPKRSKHSRSAKKPKRNNKRRPKRSRSGYGGDSDITSDGDSDEDESSEEEAIDSFSDDEPVQKTASGRPSRRAAVQAKYEDPSSSSEEIISDSDVAPRKSAVQKKLVVKLKTGGRTPTPNRTTAPSSVRTTRTRSGSHAPSDHGLGIRRSSRIAHDDNVDLFGLTNSGNLGLVRKGTMSPEVAARPQRGGKGLKAPPKSIIEEEDEPSSFKEEADDSRETDREIMESMQDLIDDDDVGDAGQNPPDDMDTEKPEDEDAAMHDETEQKAVQEEDEESEDSIVIPRRTNRSKAADLEEEAEQEDEAPAATRRSLRSRSSGRTQRKLVDESSDFEPHAEGDGDDDLSDSDASDQSPKKGRQQGSDADDSTGRISRSRRAGRGAMEDNSDIEEPNADEVAEELQELRSSRPRRKEAPAEIVYEKPRRRNRQPVDYRILRPETMIPTEEAEAEIETPSRRNRGGGGTGGGGWQRSLFSTYGPFGGAGGPNPVLGPSGAGAGGVDSDSSDDEIMQKPRGVGGMPGMTPTTALPQGLGLFPQTHSADPAQNSAGTPANLGKIKDRQALADADPLGVDQNVNFDSVGGLQGHIDQLKEMVALPLLYPEIFQRFHIVPPRGVLFHGPPGTGKTLLARALASSVSTEGRKVTFYMRKGADALSKWVGEAERQLRLLFEEARKTQPSIIFFDEIDGLAPVRSSKQEQIHASIVSTLLALMDGMDGRGQVIVIGATNRPDSIDPALRRPGRFDREFYFPLPNLEARRAILDINTKGWEPPLPDAIKDELAEMTKGYGGADLRALCTEAALNAVQRRYPQIYKSKEKLLIDPKQIDVIPKDFMISIKRMIPSSERATSSNASPLPNAIEPLLRSHLLDLTATVDQILPRKRKLTALQEAEFEEPTDNKGFAREKMQQDFEKSRVFRPRLLIHGPQGMGQQYLAAALLNHFEGIHVQSFDLATLLSDSTRSPEATVVQLFTEVKRHKPSVIYIPDVQTWYATVGQSVISTFLGLLRSLAPTDPILLLGVLESARDDVDEGMLKSFFGYSAKNRFELHRPDSTSRKDFFSPLVKYVRMLPSDFPDPENRKKRKLEILKPAPLPPPKPAAPPSKAELQAQRKKDRLTLNMLKIRIQPIMDQIKKYKKFRTGVVDENQIRYLYDEEDPNIFTTDLPIEQRSRVSFRPFEKGTDAKGHPGLIETVSNKFFYNLDIVVIEKRLSNGYYKRPADFLLDIKRLTKDAKTLGDQDRLLKANELQANVEVDIGAIEMSDPALVAECEQVYQRELEREKEALEKAKRTAEAEGKMAPPLTFNIAHGPSDQSSATASGPVVLGQTFNDGQNGTSTHSAPPQHPSDDTSLLTNGHTDQDLDSNTGARLSNGSNEDATHGGDVQMSNSDIPSVDRDTQNSSFGPSAQPKPPHSYTAPSQQIRRESGMEHLSQKEALTPMEPGSQPGDYVNAASTTQSTSVPKNSNRSSDQHATQGSWPSVLHFNADPTSRADAPELAIYPSAQSVEGVPDTQPDPPFSQSQTSTTSQGHQSNLKSLLNAPDDGSPPDLIMDQTWVATLHSQLTDRTSGLSIEQLEQVNSALMECIWEQRGNWNRTRVGDEVRIAFDMVLADMQETQRLENFSYESARRVI